MRLLIVCTGNICRSPLGEVVVRHALSEAGLAAKTQVASAGTWDGQTGEPADPRAVAAAARRGYDLLGFVARGVRHTDFTEFDVMLGMTQGHVQELESKRPRAATVAIRRYLDLSPTLLLRDVADPYLGSDADFDVALDRIEEGVPGIVAMVRAHNADRAAR